MEYKPEMNRPRGNLIFEYLQQISENLDSYEALGLGMHRLSNINLKATARKSVLEVFAVLGANIKAFGLLNSDLLFIYPKDKRDEISSCLVKVRFLLQEDPLLKNADDLQGIGFVTYFDLVNKVAELTEYIKKSQVVAQSEAVPDEKGRVQNTVFTTTNKKLKKELSTELLGKVQKILSVADFSSFIRRQSICAIIGKSAPQRVFDEVYVSIPDLQEMLLPDVDLTSNPWLFLSLSETLDKKVLQTISRHDDGSLLSNFSININVSTILSDDFLAFDNSVNFSMRSSIVLELQLMDIFSDINAFILAKTFAQARGYKICIDGITVDKLKYLNRTNLNCDLLKIIWHPTFMDVLQEDAHFMDYVNKAERAKMILCRVDDAKAIEVGNSLGINLYQGRYVQKMLTNRTGLSK